jgi:hypothetical protein
MGYNLTLNILPLIRYTHIKSRVRRENACRKWRDGRDSNPRLSWFSLGGSA